MNEFAWSHVLVGVSALISIVGASTYIRDTLRGKTKPNRVTWSMWALAPLIGFAAAWSSGADFWANARIFLAGFLPLIVFLSSFLNSHSYWKLTRFDFVCGALSLTALIAWLGVDAPRLAILLAATADGLASVPTIVKAWRYPETETGVAYMASLLSVALVLPSIPVWNIENAAFQVYLLLINIALIIAVYRRRIFTVRSLRES